MPDTQVDMMGPLGNYDLTGLDEAFVFTNEQFVIYKANQVVEFKRPVFVSGLTVQRVISDTEKSELVPGTGWKYFSTDEDVYYASKAKLEDPTFNKVLVKSIIITNADAEEFSIVVDGHNLLRDIIDIQTYRPDGPEYTVEMMRRCLEQLMFLTASSHPITSVTADLQDAIAIRPLDVDSTGTKAENYVTDEQHAVASTTANGIVVVPAQGSFYYKRLVVKFINNEGTESTLVDGVDYIVFGSNLQKNKASSSGYEIFDFILIKNARVGTLKVSYQAFGGGVNQVDLYTLKLAVTSVLNFFTNTRFLTANDLPYTNTVLAMGARLSNLEMYMRQYPFTSHVIQKSASANGYVNWYTIGVLDKINPYVSVTPTKDTAHLMLAIDGIPELMDLRVDFDLFTYDINTTQKRQMRVTRPFSDANPDIDTVCGVSGFGTVGGNEYRDINTVYLRTVWNDDGSQSGAVIQIGLLNNLADRAITIFNKSGVGSLFKLTPPSGSVYLAPASAPKLPSGATWAASGRCVTQLDRPFGTPIFIGNVPLKDQTVYILDTLKQDATTSAYETTQSCSMLAFTLFDRLRRQLVTTRVPLNPILFSGQGEANKFTGDAIVESDDFCMLTYTLIGAGNFRISQLKVVPTLGSHGEDNARWDLRHVALYHH